MTFRDTSKMLVLCLLLANFIPTGECINHVNRAEKECTLGDLQAVFSSTEYVHVLLAAQQ